MNQSFDVAARPYSAKPDNPHKPVVPEADAYGFIFTLLLAALVAPFVLRRRRKGA